MPPGKVSSAGPEAIDLAASAGLFLDPWQCWVCEEGLAERSDGKWAAFEAAVIAARQNGKDAIFEAIELAGLFLFGEMLIVHSAHKFDTAQEHFLRMQTLIDGCPDLSRKVRAIHTANGKEAVVLMSGARLKFVARSRGSARGFTGDRLILNEAMFLPPESVGSMLPALAAVENPQVWYGASAAHADSHVLQKLRTRGMSADAGRLFFAEWGNEPGVDPEDRDAWAAANPGLGIRITEEFIEDEYVALGQLGEEFTRERLGVPSAEDSGAGVFGQGKWPACFDEDSQISGEPVVALDVGPLMSFASFSVAGRRADGLAHVELIERHSGTGWVVERAEYYAESYGPVGLDPRGPVRGLLADLKDAGVPTRELSDGELPTACAALQKSVQAGTVRHIGQRPLDDAVAGAQIRPQGDSWRWSRSASSVDITPLVAGTIALHYAADVPGVSEYVSLSEV